ncbi:zinc-binding dehydrogenase [Sporosarcina soli]|uniref:Zinc-binding dehydrogenase n=1 Tax=Sporosarcina soli TaxID=334736 RepID=A0ABW0TPN1_9BACL
MRAVLIDENLNINISEANIPEVEEGYALIKVKYSGVCGTDLSISYGGLKHRINYPLIMGHEFSGVVEQLNGETDLAIGDRVVVDPLYSCGNCISCKNNQHQVCTNLKVLGIEYNGSFAEYVAIPFENIHKVPDNLSDKLACLIEPLSVTHRAVNKADLQENSSVLILGGGPIGLMLGLIAKEKGVKDVFLSEVNPHRLKIAKEFGFKTIDGTKIKNIGEYLMDNFDGKVDVVFEAAGSPITAQQMTTVVKEQGKVILVGLFKEPPLLDLSTMQYKEITLLTSRSYTRHEFKSSIPLSIKLEKSLEKIISHIVDVDNANEALTIMKSGQNVLKVLIKS